MILCVADLRAKGAGRVVVGGQIELEQGALYRGGLIVVVKNGEIAGKSKMRGLAAEQARAEGVERGDPHVGGGLPAGLQDAVDTIAHDFGGLVGEGDGEDGVSRHVSFEQMGDAVGDHARLARAGARQYQHGAFGSENGFALAFVESVEKRHRVRRVRWVGQERILTERMRMSNFRMRSNERSIAATNVKTAPGEA